MNNLLKAGTIITLAVLGTACGGGGGGGGSSTPTSTTSANTFPLAQSIADFISNSHNYNLTAGGSVSGYTIGGSGTLSYASGTAATFEGQQAFKQATTLTGTLFANGRRFPYDLAGEDFYTTDYDYLGYQDADGKNYCVAQSPEIYPSSVKAGDTGTLGTFNCYQDSTKAVHTEDDVDTYVVEPDTTTSAIVNINTNTYSLTKTLTTSSQVRYRIDNAGNLNFVSVSVTDYTASPATVITFTVK